jgi:hypothetical protein
MLAVATAEEARRVTASSGARSSRRRGTTAEQQTMRRLIEGGVFVAEDHEAGAVFSLLRLKPS